MFRFRRKKQTSNFQKRRYVDSPRYYTQLYAASKKPQINALEERKVRKRKQKYDRKRAVGSLSSLLKGLVSKRALIFGGIVLFITLAYILLRNLNFFLVDNFEVYGNSRLTNEEIVSAVSDFKNENLFSFSVSDVESKLENEFLYVKEVYVRKKLPDTLEIEVIERQPLFVLTSFSGNYVFDKEYKVLSANENEGLALLPFEREVLGGSADPNDNYVKERYLLKINEEELTSSSWDEVALEEKQKLLAEIESEVNAQVQAYINNALEIVAEEYKSLPQVIFYEEQSFPSNTSIDLPKVTFSSEVIQKLLEDFEVRRLTWISDYSVTVSLPEGKSLIISRTRDLSDQLEDFRILVKRGGFENGNTIDVRVSTLSVE